MNRRDALATLAFTLGAAEGASAQTPLPSLRVASTANDDATSMVYAVQSGLFRNAGLDVTFQKSNSGAVVAAAVAAGAIDIGKSSTIPLITAHARDIPFVVIGAASFHHDKRLDSAVVVANDGPRAARDLNGKICSVAGLQDTTWLATRAWVDQNGGNSESVRFIEVPGSSVLSALQQGRIDAGTMSEPYITQNVKSGKARLFAPHLDAIAARWYLALYFTTREFAAKNQAAIATFQRVMAQSAAYCNAHQSETVPMMSTVSGLDPAVLAEVTRATFPTDLDPRYIQPVIDAAVKYKLVEKRFDARGMM